MNLLRIIRWSAWGGIGVVAFLVVAVTGGWLVTDGPLGERQVATGPSSLPIGGPFTLTDHRGRVVTEQDFRSKPMAVFFGFTYCPDVCPTTLGNMTRLIERLGSEADRLHWLFMSVDAERDTPREMAEYVAAFDSRIVGLSGTEAQVASAAKAFRIYYRKVPLRGGGFTMDHSAGVVLLDSQGRFAGTLDHEESEEVSLQKLQQLVVR